MPKPANTANTRQAVNSTNPVTESGTRLSTRAA